MVSDLVAAISTAPGRAALAVVRISGRGAFEVAARVLGWPADRTPVPRQATLATFHEADGAVIDHGLVTFFPGPDSYTGEDLVEFSTHGGNLVPTQLLAALLAAGARPAGPGEFTRRAFQNGKLDLLQAEAVADLIDASTRAQGRGAIRQLEGGLSRRLLSLRSDLIDLQALLSYDIDFPEEDDGPIDRSTIAEALGRCRTTVSRLLETALLGERVRTGALVVLAGRPNVGKSSLFNALLRAERALVTEVPGTTRDTIEADLDVDGWPVRLADTAGLRSSEDRIEQLGIEVSRKYLAAADLVLLCVEAGRPLDPDEQALARQGGTVVVRTKADLAQSEGEGIPVSARTGSGLSDLARAVVEELFGDVEQVADLEPMLTRERHRLALDAAADELGQVAPHLAAAGDPVLAAHHVRRAVASLDEVVGVVDIEEILGAVFSRFCVGK
ncbi:MAG: tRNA uridine-5-carboxymethylaminomethyl(34) synthesis GTPase MnmE [Gemmatimonadales bacterium]